MNEPPEGYSFAPPIHNAWAAPLPKAIKQKNAQATAVIACKPDDQLAAAHKEDDAHHSWEYSLDFWTNHFIRAGTNSIQF